MVDRSNLDFLHLEVKLARLDEENGFQSTNEPDKLSHLFKESSSESNLTLWLLLLFSVLGENIVKKRGRML